MSHERESLIKGKDLTLSEEAMWTLSYKISDDLRDASLSHKQVWALAEYIHNLKSEPISLVDASKVVEAAGLMCVNEQDFLYEVLTHPFTYNGVTIGYGRRDRDGGYTAVTCNAVFARHFCAPGSKAQKERGDD